MQQYGYTKIVHMLGLASKAVLKNGRASSILPNPTVSKPVLWFASGCLGCTLRIAAYRRCAFCTVLLYEHQQPAVELG